MLMPRRVLMKIYSIWLIDTFIGIIMECVYGYLKVRGNSRMSKGGYNMQYDQQVSGICIFFRNIFFI